MFHGAMLAPPIAIPPYNENPVDWDTLPAQYVRAKRLQDMNTWLTVLRANLDKYEDPRDASPGFPTAFFMTNYATVEVRIVGGGTFRATAASNGGDPGLHAERAAYLGALRNAGVVTLLGPNPLMMDASQLMANFNLYISSIYTERELCKPAHGGHKPCSVWLQDIAGGNNTTCVVNYSFQYSAFGKKQMRDEIHTFLRDEVNDTELWQWIWDLWKDRI